VKKAGDVLKRYLREKGWLDGGPYDALFRAWPAIAGNELAPHTRLVDVQKGMLLVEVDHPGWLQMVRLRQAGLLEAARQVAPNVPVSGIKARVGAGHTRPGGEH
jgi:predicted nucleic acid-binding Zn ribbon protein